MVPVFCWIVSNSDTEEEEHIIPDDEEQIIPGDEEQIITEDEEQIIAEDQECHNSNNSENDIHSLQSMYMFQCKQILSSSYT